MRHRISIKGAAAAAAGLASALLFANVAQSQLLGATQKEIERTARVEWLQMKRHMPQSPTPQLQNYVECIAHSIIDVLDPSFGDLAWEVVVFDDDAMNAFAMPGGKIGVFTGILRVADTPDALAAVLGHEIAHLTADHVMQRARRNIGTELLSMIGGAAIGNRDVARTASTIGFGLPFNRGQESEADVIGLEYMADAGFDPRSSIHLWKNMSSSRQSHTAEFLSTHPADDRRLDDLVKNLTPALIKYNVAQEAGKRPNCGQPR